MDAWRALALSCLFSSMAFWMMAGILWILAGISLRNPTRRKQLYRMRGNCAAIGSGTLLGFAVCIFVLGA